MPQLRDGVRPEVSARELELGWCGHDAARHAVLRWHYSRRMPSGKLARVGVWERDEFVGCVLFGRGATPMIARPFALEQTEVIELVRVALGEHRTPTSRVVAIALRMVRRKNPGLKLVVSYADTARGHHGGIYQAGNWIYLGAAEMSWIRVRGKLTHPRSLGAKYGRDGQSIPWLRENVDPGAERVAMPPKHKYVMPLTRELRSALLPQARPYPKRAGSIDADAPGAQPGEGGSTPTPALQG